MSKTRTRRRRRPDRGASRKRGGGLMLGMRSGFKGMAHAVAGEQQPERKSRTVAGVIAIVFVIAALGLLMSRL
jgi:hypothetical protein